jgi:GNAT superfamily N-acetyltransferase
VAEPGPAGLEIHPATAERWPDLEALFGERGACGGCWCMWYRLPRAGYEQAKGAANRRALQDLVTSGPVPGLLAYADGQPVGWCSMGPREAFPRLATSRTMRGLDGAGVWSIVCLFVAPRWRRQGISTALLSAAAEYAVVNGAAVVEGYAVVPRKPEVPPVFAATGLLAAFLGAGFSEVARPSKSRALVRWQASEPAPTP